MDTVKPYPDKAQLLICLPVDATSATESEDTIYEHLNPLAAESLANHRKPRVRAFPKWPDNIAAAQAIIFTYKYL